ncbi:hypothetical protein RN001_006717 [Aquatica leii]|uniref:Mutator-like transposase domain-containing protein n=1 Tax=Aquatica leii TaxID=1421715 RepID=A0AAN7QL77_9COLE|nr:hypothetical protein RN001_006717 [Aquatica leii]
MTTKKIAENKVFDKKRWKLGTEKRQQLGAITFTKKNPHKYENVSQRLLCDQGSQNSTELKVVDSSLIHSEPLAAPIHPRGPSLIKCSRYCQMNEYFSSIDLPCMSNSTFCKYFQDVSKHIQEISWNSFKEAADEEARIAKDEDCVDENGTPIITVIVDGAWSKRSYRKNYNSLSGVVCDWTSVDTTTCTN